MGASCAPQGRECHFAWLDAVDCDQRAYTLQYTLEVYMRTNIVLDDALVKEAFRHAPVKTKRELVDLALREFVASRKRRDIRDLIGKVGLDPAYDYKKARIGK
jgi:Arc/MetJ family transcription regulator